MGTKFWSELGNDIKVFVPMYIKMYSIPHQGSIITISCKNKLAVIYILQMIGFIPKLLKPKLPHFSKKAQFNIMALIILFMHSSFYPGEFILSCNNNVICQFQSSGKKQASHGRWQCAKCVQCETTHHVQTPFGG